MITSLDHTVVTVMMVQVMIISVMIYADGKKCDADQWKDVMIASLVVSAVESHGRSNDGQCDDHVGQCEVDAIITLVSDHIIGQSHIGRFDDGQYDAHVGQCVIIFQRADGDGRSWSTRLSQWAVMMVNVMSTSLSLR